MAPPGSQEAAVGQRAWSADDLWIRSFKRENYRIKLFDRYLSSFLSTDELWFVFLMVLLYLVWKDELLRISPPPFFPRAPLYSNGQKDSVQNRNRRT